MNQNVKLWLRAANPFTPPRGMAEAQRAARVAVVALAVGIVQLFIGLLYMPKTEALVQMMTAQQKGQVMTAQQVAIQDSIVGMMPMFTLVATLAFSVVYVVLAVVQWRRMTWVIPTIMLAFMAYGFLGGIGALVKIGSLIEFEFAFSSALMWLANLATIALYAAAFRGGRMLDQLKRSV
ncbi:hypothetical protein [Brevundimonas bullata]|uniref:hypothetical protein n=1 Tax=Brevundimonas bullata TaxID=13160 RepID=UPI003D9A88AF